MSALDAGDVGDTLSLSIPRAVPKKAKPIAIVESPSLPHMDGWILAVKHTIPGAESDDDEAYTASKPKRGRFEGSAGAGSERFAIPEYPAKVNPVIEAAAALDLRTWADALKRLPPEGRKELMETLVEAAEKGYGLDGIPDKVRHIYKDVVSVIKEPEAVKQIRLPPGTSFQILPEVDATKRDTIYLAAPPGAGKSHWIGGYTRRYAEMHPDRPRWLISHKQHDAVLDAGIGPKNSTPLVRRISIPDLMSKPVDIEKDFEGPALVIFDDIDTLEGKAKEVVRDIMKRCINVGRACGLSVIVTNHLLTDYNNTRGIINDSTHIVLFPDMSLAQSIAYVGSKIGLTKEQIGRLRKMGRWVCISKQGAKWMVGEGKAEILE